MNIRFVGSELCVESENITKFGESSSSHEKVLSILLIYLMYIARETRTNNINRIEQLRREKTGFSLRLEKVESIYIASIALLSIMSWIR